MKKAFVFCVSIVFFFSLHMSSVFAKAPLNETVDELLGIRYQWAGETLKGFDCSGFTKYVFKQFGIDLPHYSKGQSKEGKAVSKKNLVAGDLVFFNTGGKGISHVGIYLGQGEFVHASSNKGVMKSKLSEQYYEKRYVSAVRILNEEQYTDLTTDSANIQEIKEKHVSLVK